MTTHKNTTVFDEIWYRPTLAKKGLFVMADTGSVEVAEDKILFQGKKSGLEIQYENFISISYGRQGADFINKWTKIKYRDNGVDSYALFSGGKELGWGAAGVAKQIFLSIKTALNNKGLARIVEN